MNRIITCLLVVISSAVIAEGREEHPVFDASDTESILAKTGQKITVRGIVSTAEKSKSGTTFIRFKDGEFYLVTFKSDLKAFRDNEPADLYKGEYLAVTGVISIYKNKPQMKLTHPGMVQIINEDGPAPAPGKVTERKTSKSKPVAKTSKHTVSGKTKKIPPIDPKNYFK